MSESQSMKQGSDDREFLKGEFMAKFLDPKLGDRQIQSILDAVQYVEVFNAYGRGGHLQDMTIYGLFNALKEALVLNSKLSVQVWDLTGAKEALDQNLALIKYKNEKLDRIKALDYSHMVGDLTSGEFSSQLNAILDEKPSESSAIAD